MNWCKFKNEERLTTQLINPKLNKYYIYLSPREYANLPEEEETFDIECICTTYTGNPDTNTLKTILTNLIDEYDKSDEVNRFIFNGETAWFDKQTRLGLVNSLNIEKELNKDISTIWINGKPYVVNIDYMLQFLRYLEGYSIQTFQITQQHKYNVINLNNREEIFNYNITTEYPEPIELTID